MYKKICLLAFVFIFTMGFYLNKAWAAENLDDLYIEIGDAIMKTKEADWDSVQANLDKFTKQWNEVKDADSKKAAVVDKN